MNSVERFERLYFGDRTLRAVYVDTQSRTITLDIDSVDVLDTDAESAIFEPETTFEPARLVFRECIELRVLNGVFSLNSTVVQSSANVLGDGKVEFRFSLTGGYNNETFWNELGIVARDFEIQSLNV
jgi:hypothetical protein